jgi:hypothetical protein
VHLAQQVDERLVVLRRNVRDAHLEHLTAKARGKPHRSAQHEGNLQAELVGVGLTNQLGRCAQAQCCT